MATSVSLRDIRELIMDTGIGVDGYSIIGQGKIAEIVSNKPESRREILKRLPAIVHVPVAKKAEAERKLESCQRQSGSCTATSSARSKGRIDGLKEDSIKAKEYLKLRDRYKELEINIILEESRKPESKK